MAKPGRPSISKRQKERQRAEKRQRKAEKRDRRKVENEGSQVDAEPGEEPDIAGIVPGPQPLPYEIDEGD